MRLFYLALIASLFLIAYMEFFRWPWDLM